MAKFCASCGSSLNDETQFCPNCGAPTNGASQNTNPQMSNPQVGPQMAAPQMGTPVAGGKSKMVAGLLGIFLGAWGFHNFYLGNLGKGILQIVLTIVTCGIAGIWGFIEGILILTGSINTDSNGNPLSE